MTVAEEVVVVVEEEMKDREVEEDVKRRCRPPPASRLHPVVMLLVLQLIPRPSFSFRQHSLQQLWRTPVLVLPAVLADD